jgi:hypothetical protein
MAVGFYFTPQSFTKQQYDEAIKRLQDAGAGSPPGRSYHFAFSSDGENIQVFDVWESEQDFQKFGETLVPIMAELGSAPGDPHVAEVHNVIVG